MEHRICATKKIKKLLKNKLKKPVGMIFQSVFAYKAGIARLSLKHTIKHFRFDFCFTH